MTNTRVYGSPSIQRIAPNGAPFTAQQGGAGLQGQRQQQGIGEPPAPSGETAVPTGYASGGEPMAPAGVPISVMDRLVSAVLMRAHQDPAGMLAELGLDASAPGAARTGEQLVMQPGRQQGTPVNGGQPMPAELRARGIGAGAMPSGAGSLSGLPSGAGQGIGGAMSLDQRQQAQVMSQVGPHAVRTMANVIAGGPGSGNEAGRASDVTDAIGRLDLSATSPREIDTLVAEVEALQHAAPKVAATVLEHTVQPARGQLEALAGARSHPGTAPSQVQRSAQLAMQNLDYLEGRLRQLAGNAAGTYSK